jgi:hypothetical protein
MPRHIASVSWGDHLLFGEGDGRLASPDAVARRLDRWRTDLGAERIHWRFHHRTRVPGRYQAARGRVHPSFSSQGDIDWDDLEVVPRLAREAGLQPWLYVSLFDEGWPLAPLRVRKVSYHNAMHGQHVAWQSEFSRTHPEFAVVDREGRRQWGVLSLAYPEVRAYFRERFLGLLRAGGFDRLFVCLRSQSRPAEHADQYGFNEPVRREFLERYDRDILAGDFDVQTWRAMLGSYLTRFLEELGEDLTRAGHKLAVGAPRGDVMGPPFGNATLDWREWVRRRLLDHLVIDQNSSQCPSMWHQLWPMHRGYGYLENYLDGRGLPPLAEHVATAYAPIVEGSGVELYVARQWHARDAAEETALTRQPGVRGLVFSTFRFDNPEAVARGDWRA